MRRIIVTSGDPAGVGPDLCLELLQQQIQCSLTVIGDYEVLRTRAQMLGKPFNVADYKTHPKATRSIWHHPLDFPVTIGKLSMQHADFILSQLSCAAKACLNGEFDALLTAPVSKENILAAGHHFIGQTEFIASAIETNKPVMLLTGPRLRICLATTHIPLKDVASTITTENILYRLRLLHQALPRYFGLQQAPDIRVCGLNPHAGENGYLGTEEQEIITPAIKAAQCEGINVQGPLPADTAILQAVESKADCVLVMYHDQGLPAIKLLDFEKTINVTLGLPFLRASPDHGVALDIAATGKMCMQSSLEALHFLCHATP